MFNQGVPLHPTIRTLRGESEERKEETQNTIHHHQEKCQNRDIEDEIESVCVKRKKRNNTHSSTYPDERTNEQPSSQASKVTNLQFPRSWEEACEARTRRSDAKSIMRESERIMRKENGEMSHSVRLREGGENEREKDKNARRAISMAAEEMIHQEDCVDHWQHTWWLKSKK